MSSTARRPPNIVWFCTDQQRWDTLGCFGNPFVRTPNLDRLASTGAAFERFYTQSSVCLPSRVSFNTGRYPRTTHARSNADSIPTGERLITRILADAGYVCGLSGKLHVSGVDPETGLERRIDDGLSEFYESEAPGPHWPGDVLGAMDAKYRAETESTNQYTGWLAKRGLSYQPGPHESSPWVEVGMQPESHQTTWCVDRGVDFIQEQPKDQPWLLAVNPYDPHHPFDPPAEYLKRYLDHLDELPLPNYRPGELNEKPAPYETCHRGAYGAPGKFAYSDMTDRDHRLIRAAYWAMIDLIDVQVGRMMQAIADLGQADNTLMLFMADHGEMLGDHGVYLKGPFLSDPAVHVPLVIHGAGVQRGLRSRALVEAVDLVPTVLDAAGIAIPANVQGKSLWPLLTGKVDPDHHREDIYSEYYNAAGMMQRFNWKLSLLRNDRYALISMRDHDEGELYDHQNDPLESYNLWDDPAHQAIKAQMLNRLCDRLD
ncbi:MAG TPA: sulfatase-like hydrolase/transferase [Bauldia sp.]|nr:sulfatase-like hydrolase/transferase [Bauldia sp.]